MKKLVGLGLIAIALLACNKAPVFNSSYHFKNNTIMNQNNNVINQLNNTINTQVTVS